MPEVILTDEQAQILSTATGEVLVRDRHGRDLGRVKPSDDEAAIIAEARRRLASHEREYSTAEVLDYLQRLEQQ